MLVKSQFTSRAAAVFEKRADQLVFWVEKLRLPLLGAFTILFFAATMAISMWRPFWYDELFTFYIGKLPTLADIRSALANAVDQLPLPYYLVTRASQFVFGEGELGSRFPSMVGYWLGCMCLFFFVALRTSALHGWIAVVLALASSFSYRYAYEARPYGLVFGFGAAAILCWRTAADGHSRKLSLSGLALSLTAAMCSHYYAILLLCPIGIGELTRTVIRKRIDVAVWAAMLPTFIPLAFANVGKNLETYGSNFWSAPRLSFFITFYERMLASLLLPAAVLMLVFAALFLLRADTRDETRRMMLPAPPLYEMAAVFGLAVFPVFGYGLAVLVTNALVPRYVLPTVLGFAVLVAYLTYFGARGRSAPGVVVLFLLAGGAGLSAIRDIRALQETRPTRMAMALPRAAIEQPDPIVVENPMLFFEATHRSREAGRLYYLVDPATASKYSYTYLDPGLPLLRQVAPVNVEEFGKFVIRTPRFVVYRKSESDYGNGWLLNRVLDAGGNVELLSLEGADSVYRVSYRSKVD